MIKRIRIQNFRSLADVTVDLDPVTVLIGRSGTGKSNFVQAIRFLRDSLNARMLDFSNAGGIDHILHVDLLKEKFGYEIFFTIDDTGPVYHYSLYRLPGGHIDEFLQVDNTSLFHHNYGKWVIAPETKPTPKPTGIMLGAIPGLQESTFAFVALRSSIGCYDYPGFVLTGPGNKGEPLDRGFSDSGDNYLLIADRILSDLSKAKNWKHLSGGMRTINNHVENLTLNVPTPDRIDVGLRLKDRILTFDVRRESEGFRRYLAHLLAMYQTPSKQVLLFEHPESGIHPAALEGLATEFKLCAQEGRGQVILTTHSPQFLDFFPPEAIRVVEIENQNTRIGPVAPEQMESLRDHLLQPGELLTVDPARLAGQLTGEPA